VKIAVVLFNLGGPDSPEAVQPFLRNLFGDRAIIDLPAWLRLPLAQFLASRRAVKARRIYDQIGGASPILGQTEAQAAALDQALSGDEHQWRAFVCMRYWHPLTADVVQQVRTFAPARIVLLPLYPQFSTTTTASSVGAWKEEAARLKATTTLVCCYPQEAGFIAASVDLVQQELAALGSAKARVLFSAHGLPQKVIASGDPYQWQVECTAQAIAAAARLSDWTVCYQSRVGPLKWIGPSTHDEIERAGREKMPVVIYPLAFVSEHSETLVELDRDYRALAEASGVPVYRRAPTVGTHPAFISGLAKAAHAAAFGGRSICTAGTHDICSAEHVRCPRRMASL